MNFKSLLSNSLLISMGTLGFSQMALANSYCDDLLSNKSKLIREVNVTKAKMRTAKSFEAREYYLNKYDSTYELYAYIDHKFTRECR